MQMHWREYLFSFHGRVNRAKWWLSWLIFCIYSFAVTAICVSTLALGLLVSWVLMLPLLWPWLAIGEKRLHDRGKTGWWLVLFYLAPILLMFANVVAMGEVTAGDIQAPSSISTILSLAVLVLIVWGFVELGVLRGTRGDNTYGPDPLAHAAANAS